MNSKILATLVCLSVVLTAVFANIAVVRSLSALENVMLQVFSMLIGLVCSVAYGKQSAKDAAKDVIRPHAKSAFRRLISLYKSLWRLAESIQIAKLDKNYSGNMFGTLNTLEAIVVEQLSTANDALEDWRDIVPEDVEELHAQMRKSGERGVGHE